MLAVMASAAAKRQAKSGAKIQGAEQNPFDMNLRRENFGGLKWHGTGKDTSGGV